MLGKRPFFFIRMVIAINAMHMATINVVSKSSLIIFLIYQKIKDSICNQK